MAVPGREATVKLRIRCGDAYALGPGKAALLEAVDAFRSIAAAGRHLGCSYWKTRHLVDEMNRCFKAPVVATMKGGSERGGALLTETGRQALEIFRAMEAKALEAVQADFPRLEDLLEEAPRPGPKGTDEA